MFGPRTPYVIFASYGNDSVALIQFAHEAGLSDVTVLYSDTGWAADGWLDRVAEGERWARSRGFKTDRTESEGLESLVKRKKGWPRQGIQFCTAVLKIEPALEWLDAIDPIGMTVCLTGVRREESGLRKNYPETVERSPNHGMRTSWSPLVRHTEADRDALLARAGFEPLPHRSRECWPCVNENREGLQQLDEKTISKIERIESDLGFTSKGKPRTMFRPYRHMGATGIRQVVKWANSPRGKFDPDDGTGFDCDTGYCGL